MASPPYQGATSPTSSTPLALPRQRPSLALPTTAPRRKPSITSATSSSHPLRQTSFPPPDSLEAQHQQAEDHALSRYSPDADDNVSLESDEDITSAISGPAGDDAFASAARKRKRGAEPRRARGRPPKNGALRRGSTSVINGDDARSTITAIQRRGGTAGAGSVTGAEAGEEDDDDDDEDAGADARGGAHVLDAAELEQENKRRYLFREAVPPAHQNRYDAYNKVKLRTSDVRRLVNATLSQSVPQNVVTVVGAYTKMFAGMLIEGAREVQTEWMAVAAKLPDGAENVALGKLRMMREEVGEEEEGKEEDEGPKIKVEEKGEGDGKAGAMGELTSARDHRHDGLPDGDIDSDDEEAGESREGVGTIQMNGDTNGNATDEPKDTSSEMDEVEYVQPGAWGLIKVVDESARGPLLADHLRESLRRYKKSRSGGSVGFTGLSLEGRDVAAPRMGGRRLFR